VLLTIRDLRNRVANNLPALVDELRDLTGRYGESEAQAWESSLPQLASALASPSFHQLHLYFGGEGSLALEYRLPASSSWCDTVLLGSHRGKPATVILELKHWQTRADQPGSIEGLMFRQGANELHPSDQVRGYTEFCRRFHSTVLEHQASVYGCVVFTRDFHCDAYRQPPNDKLTLAYPCFTLSDSDVSTALPEFFASRLSESDEGFARSFEQGRYQQDRGFCKQIAAQLSNPTSCPFELLDGQRKAYSECLDVVRRTVFSGTGLGKRKVIIVNGPPGSGKSVVAAKLWANLVSDPKLPEGNVVFTTTSLSQSSNWQALFEKASRQIAARGVVIKANEYVPCTTQDIGRWRRQLRDAKLLADAARWRENLKLINSLRKEGLRTPDQHYLVSVVDEAHALINPEHSDARGQFGFAVAAGPQAYHIIRGSVVSIFFLDSAQSFRERETTTVADIKSWASELGADVVAEISLEENQFRCAGSKEYVEWVERLLVGKDAQAARSLVLFWNSNERPERKHPLAKFDLRVFESLFEMEEALRAKLSKGASARLLASYARKWKSGNHPAPHDLPAAEKDFCEAITSSGCSQTWSRIWNFVPGTDDYSAFVQAPPGTAMHADPLCEVGCPYAVRGFDFDYVGLLWLGDLKWRNGGWTVDPEHSFESGLPRHLSRARAATHGGHPDVIALSQKIRQGYRILMTRAMKGPFIWFEDKETAEAVNTFLK
jgi:uncharacterized protein